MRLSRSCALLAALLLLPVFPVHADDDASFPNRIVYDRNGNIYWTAPGAGETALVEDGESHTPIWSPDGSKILFIRNTSLQTIVYDDGTTAEIGQPTDFYTIDRDGKNLRRLRHMDGVVSDPSFAPDGKILGFFYQSKEEWLHQGIPGFLSGFFEMPTDGKEKPHLVSAEARHVDWSPDSKKLVFTVARPNDHVALHIANADGSGEAQLLDEDIFVNSDYAKWSPDGSQIAFQATVRHKIPGGKFAFQSTIFTAHPDGTSVRQLTYDLGWDCWHPWWLPGTSRLTYYCYSMPGCMPANVKSSPENCTGRTFTVQMDDPHAKPVQTAEQQGIAGGMIPQVAPK